MKIKTVCEKTGLTDRTVRYYIDEQMISPAFTENYLGRKTFDFSEADIAQLKDIAILRKFGFTIAEIQKMLSDSGRILPLVRALQERKETAIEEEQALLQVLRRMESKTPCTIAELASALSAPVLADPILQEHTAFNFWKVIRRFLRSFFLAILIWLPVAVSLLAAITTLRADEYPVFEPKALILVAVFLTPSVVLPILLKCKSRLPIVRILKIVLGALCIISIPFCGLFSMCISTRSETTDFRNYREFDADCLANKSPFFQDLFPQQPHYFDMDSNYHKVYLDAHYLYRDLPAMDYTYDIYAEWPLEKDEFDTEVQRVSTLYAGRDYDYFKYVVVEKGNYTCLFAYEGLNPPFEPVTDSYTYYIFAYDEENLRVRYILCQSLENGADQPYYLSLDWE